VSLYIDAGCLTTEIRDCGDFKAVRQPADILEERGRGLPLMFALMDSVEIDSAPGQTVVRLAKRLAA
jgi:anti-sigma regulatory factor (Ser/Thr protein kinase)